MKVEVLMGVAWGKGAGLGKVNGQMGFEGCGRGRGLWEGAGLGRGGGACVMGRGLLFRWGAGIGVGGAQWGVNGRGLMWVGSVGQREGL